MNGLFHIQANLLKNNFFAKHSTGQTNMTEWS